MEMNNGASGACTSQKNPTRKIDSLDEPPEAWSGHVCRWIGGNMFDILTNRNKTMPGRGLYSVWIRADQTENAPLLRLWINPSIKPFKSLANDQARAAALAPVSRETSDEADKVKQSQADEEPDHFRWSLRPMIGFLILAC